MHIFVKVINSNTYNNQANYGRDVWFRKPKSDQILKSSDNGNRAGRNPVSELANQTRRFESFGFNQLLSSSQLMDN